MNTIKEISTFARETEHVQHCVTWETEFTTTQIKELNVVLQRTAALLADVGLSPDRKYTVEEISCLQTAIQCALGGER